MDSIPKKKRNEVAIELIQFFEIVTHVILYQRNVYPEELFKHVKKYGVGIHQSRHPELNDYIAKILINGVYDFLQQGIMNKFVIVIKEKYSHSMIEKFIFDVELNEIKKVNVNDMTVLHTKFRDLLIKLNAINSYLTKQNDPKQVTFTIQTHTNKFDRNKYRKWVEIEPDFEDSNHNDHEMIAVKSINTEQFKMNVMAVTNTSEKDKEES